MEDTIESVPNPTSPSAGPAFSAPSYARPTGFPFQTTFQNHSFQREMTTDTMKSVRRRAEFAVQAKQVLHSGHMIDRIQSPLRRKIYLLMEDPRSSWPAWIITWWVFFTIVFGAVVLAASTHRDLRDWPGWFPMEMAVVGCFTIEYIFRFYYHTESWQNVRRFVLSPLGFFDLLSFLPFYLELAITQGNELSLQQLGIMRIFRLFQLFRVYKDVSKIQLSTEMLIAAAIKSADAMIVILLFLYFLVLGYGTLVYFGERSTNQPSKTEQFDNIPTSIWFMLAVVSSTGYGDVVPVSPWGRLITYFAIGTGVLIFALPSVVMGRNYIAIMMSMEGAGPRGAFERMLHEENEEEFDETSTTISTEQHTLREQVSRIPRKLGVNAEVEAAVFDLRLLADNLSSALNQIETVLKDLPQY